MRKLTDRVRGSLAQVCFTTGCAAVAALGGCRDEAQSKPAAPRAAAVEETPVEGKLLP